MDNASRPRYNLQVRSELLTAAKAIVTLTKITRNSTTRSTSANALAEMSLLAHFYFPIIYTHVYAKTTTQATWTYHHSLCTNTMRGKKYSSVKGKKKDILSSQSVQQNVHRNQQNLLPNFHISCLCLYFPTHTRELMGKGGGRELVILFHFFFSNACSTMTIIS